MAIKGYWKFNGNSNDYSGHGSNFTSNNISYRNNGLNGSAYYSSSNSSNLFNAVLDNVNDNKTLVTWFKFGTDYTPTVYIKIYQIVYGANKVSFSIEYIKDNTRHCFYALRSAWGVVDNDVMPANTNINGMTSAGFYCVILVLDSSVAKLYINGTLSAQSTVSTVNGSISYASSQIILGKAATNTNQTANGFFDETKFINTAWSPAQVKNEYARVKGFF